MLSAMLQSYWWFKFKIHIGFKAIIWPKWWFIVDRAEHPEEESSSRPVEGRPRCFLRGTGGIGSSSVYTFYTLSLDFYTSKHTSSSHIWSITVCPPQFKKDRQYHLLIESYCQSCMSILSTDSNLWFYSELSRTFPSWIIFWSCFLLCSDYWGKRKAGSGHACR